MNRSTSSAKAIGEASYKLSTDCECRSDRPMILRYYGKKIEAAVPGQEPSRIFYSALLSLKTELQYYESRSRSV